MINELNLPAGVLYFGPAFGENVNSIIINFTDSIDPTQEISFMRPYKQLIASRGNGLFIFPNSQLQRLAEKYDTVSINTALDDAFKNVTVDAVILSRYTNSYWYDIIKFARQRMIPVITHLDDNLLEIPPELNITFYNHPDRQSALRGSIRESDLVIASTAPLARQLMAYEHKKIIHGDIYCPVTPTDFSSPVRRRDSVLIGYMASISHKHDIEYVLPALLPILEEFSNVRLEILGFKIEAPELEKYGDRIVCRTGVYGTYTGFRRKLSTYKWDIGLAPLRPIKYNRCKANTKWVEYSCAGSAVLASDYDPYSDLPTTCVTLSDLKLWQENLASMLDDEEYRLALVENSQRHLIENFSVESFADQFSSILSGVGVVVGGRF